MGWFWESKAGNDDPVGRLDPTLKDFLAEQAASRSKPQDPTPTQPAPTIPSSDNAPNTYRSQLGWTPGVDQSQQNSHSTSAESSTVPPESQFPDGRYASLWKSYRPQAEIETSARMEQDKMSDIIASHKNRKDAIQQVALENCVMEQVKERECWENGPWKDRMKLCREPKRNFLRCFQMQARFLNALGYLSQTRSEEEDEAIQMHADKLYHEMLDREQRDAELQTKGEALPPLPPLIEPEQTERVLGSDSAWARARQHAHELGMTGKLSDYPPQRQREILETVKRLDVREREVELQLIAAETRSRLEMTDRLKESQREEEAARVARRERGRENFGDTLLRLWNGGTK